MGEGLVDAVAVTGNGALILVLLLLSCRVGENCIEHLIFMVVSIISFIINRYFCIVEIYKQCCALSYTTYIFTVLFFFIKKK